MKRWQRECIRQPLTKEAIAEWDSILVKYPDYDWGYYRRGWFKEAVDDIDGAIEDFTISLTLDPEYVHSYILLFPNEYLHYLIFHFF